MSNTNKTPILLYIIIAALVGFNVFQWYNNSQLKSLNTEKETELFEMEKVSAELESDVEAAMASLEELRSDNAAANELIDSQKLELQTQRKKINNLIYKSRELGKAKEEIITLNASVGGYIAEINRLKEENTQLTAANTTLTKEKQVLTVDLEKEKELTTSLNKEKVLISQQKEELGKQKQKLDTQVDMASAIKLNSLTVEGRQTKGSDSKGQSRAKKLDFLRTCILTETNLLVKPGTQEIYIRLIDAQGTTVTRNDGATGGIIVNKITGEQLRYTFKGNIDYQNDDHEECFDWEPDFRLKKGEYTVIAFHRDYEIGKGTFKLK